MPNTYEGELIAHGGQIAIVVSRYNETITSKLLAGALATLKEHGVADDAIDIAWVPGAFEIPAIAHRLALTNRYAAILCLGAVIRGETTHDQHINRAVSTEIMNLNATGELPVLFGVLTVDSLEQALQRAGGSQGNKGSECAEAALRMIDLMQKLPSD